MKQLLLAVTLSLGMAGMANASVEAVPVCEVGCAGGFSTMSAASQLVGVAAVGLVVVAAIQSNKYHCDIVKTAPLPGTNYTNEKSVCFEK